MSNTHTRNCRKNWLRIFICALHIYLELPFVHSMPVGHEKLAKKIVCICFCWQSEGYNNGNEHHFLCSVGLSALKELEEPGADRKWGKIKKRVHFLISWKWPTATAKMIETWRRVTARATCKMWLSSCGSPHGRVINVTRTKLTRKQKQKEAENEEKVKRNKSEVSLCLCRSKWPSHWLRIVNAVIKKKKRIKKSKKTERRRTFSLCLRGVFLVCELWFVLTNLNKNIVWFTKWAFNRTEGFHIYIIHTQKYRINQLLISFACLSRL